MTSITENFRADIDNDGKLDDIVAKFDQTTKEAWISATVVYADGKTGNFGSSTADAGTEIKPLYLGNGYSLSVSAGELQVTQ